MGKGWEVRFDWLISAPLRFYVPVHHDSNYLLSDSCYKVTYNKRDKCLKLQFMKIFNLFHFLSDTHFPFQSDALPKSKAGNKSRIYIFINIHHIHRKYIVTLRLMLRVGNLMNIFAFSGLRTNYNQ